MPPRLHAFDLALIAVYLLGITLFGLRFRKSGKDKSLRSYFLADNIVPWWAIALSIVSAETSTLTIISVPGVAFTGDFGFLQIVLGYMIGRVVVAVLFLPLYFEGRMLTAYQLIDQRFGSTLHKVTAGLFLLTRAAAEGVRVFAVSIVVGIAIGTRDVLSIGIISALTLLYTFEGGMAAVIWTDVVQMVIYVGGTMVAIGTLGARVPGGWGHIHAVAGAAGKFQVLHFAMNLTQSYTFWAGVVGGTFLTMASHGTDQLMVQRMLAARSLRESRLALLSSGVVIFVQFTLFLLIGAGLWVFYGAGVGTSPDRLFPAFIVAEMPVGVAGLLVAAILAAAMSNLSAALNSLSSTTVVDFYMHLRPGASNERRALVSKGATVFWAAVLFGVAVYSVGAGGKGHVVEIGLSIASVAYGALLGVFLLGTLTKYATQTGAIVGMVVGFGTNLYLWQGRFPVSIGLVTVPRIAFTWYVFLGAVVTFAVGSLASLVFRGHSRSKGMAVVLLGAVLLVPVRSLAEGKTSALPGAQGYDFSAVSALISQAIAEKKLPGAVVVVGHGGKVVFEQAYGMRKLAGEPGLDGQPSAAEAMTEDTIFDMASLTKCLVTATAIMQLYEGGKLQFDDPVAKYLPGFAANGKGSVTIRQLLTHYSGLPPDVDLKDAWGLAAPDHAEGVRRALGSMLEGVPGTRFVYSDINYITLGALVEAVSGEELGMYAAEHIFKPLGMSATGYHPFAKTCGPVKKVGANVEPGPMPVGRILVACKPDTWSPYALYERTAPTAHDDESKANPGANPDFDHLLRGTVHDPTTRRMGGVAGHAGVFSTAGDVSLFAQALLDKSSRDSGPFPLKQATLRLMTSPEQPGTADGDATVFMPDGQTTKGVAERGFGWDINTAFSRPRGAVFPIGSFGHTGFTGTSLWMDAASDSYVVLLANAIHPRGGAPVSALRGQVATAAAQAIYRFTCGSFCANPGGPVPLSTVPPQAQKIAQEPVIEPSKKVGLSSTQTGIDVLEADHFAELTAAAGRHGGRLRIGLLTNQTGVDARGRRTVDVLAHAAPGVEVTMLFSPEHGISGARDDMRIGNEVDTATRLPVVSLYGAKEADRRPKVEDLKKLDAVVIDLQDAGVRFYTYETVMEYFLEAAACTHTEVIVLDRPALTGGEQVQGPVSDAAVHGYINYIPLPVRHGLTLGELARYFVGEHTGACGKTALTVVAMTGWSREEYFDATGLTWVNPSPNLRTMAAAVLYPGTAFVETTNVSVGRGSEAAFEQVGAPYVDGAALASYLNARGIAGARTEPVKMSIAEDANHYPYHGQTIPGVRLTVTDRAVFDAPALGVELLAALHHLYPAQFNLAKANTIVANAATMQMLEAERDPHSIMASWVLERDAFALRSKPYLLY